ncbi:MAG: hypothetical protein QOJ12_516, partial [Thermoleophilales bacterium]|nr:hypothetical protein [Thermoleophilales bacterium]
MALRSALAAVVALALLPVPA